MRKVTKIRLTDLLSTPCAGVPRPRSWRGLAPDMGGPGASVKLLFATAALSEACCRSAALVGCTLGLEAQRAVKLTDQRAA